MPFVFGLLPILASLCQIVSVSRYISHLHSRQQGKNPCQNKSEIGPQDGVIFPGHSDPQGSQHIRKSFMYINYDKKISIMLYSGFTIQRPQSYGHDTAQIYTILNHTNTIPCWVNIFTLRILCQTGSILGQSDKIGSHMVKVTQLGFFGSNMGQMDTLR